MTKCRRFRSSKAISLIETMVAVALTGIVLGVLGTSLAQLMALQSTSQNRLIAGILAKEVVERLRATPFDSLPPAGVTMSVRVARGDLNDSNVYNPTIPTVNNALQIDTSKFQYLTTESSGLPVTKFPGQVFLTMGSEAVCPFGTLQNTRTATVLVTWNESEPKQLELKVILSKYGIQVEK